MNENPNLQSDQFTPEVHSEVIDHTIVDVKGVKTARQNVSRYDKAGNFISQGYTEMPYDQWTKQGRKR